MNTFSKDVMLARAKKLAQPENRKQETGLSVISFILNPECYAIETKYVKEVFTLKSITHIPGLPEFVMGIILHRGSALAIVNLKPMLGLPQRGITELNKIMVIAHGQYTFGLISDLIIGETSLVESSFVAIQGQRSTDDDFIAGVTNEGTILLDIQKIIERKVLIVDQSH